MLAPSIDFRIAAMSAQILCQRRDRFGIAAFAHEDHRSPCGIGRQGLIVMPPRPTGLVYRQLPHLPIIRLGYSQINIHPANRQSVGVASGF